MGLLQVLQFLLRSSAELRALIKGTTVGSMDTSWYVAQVEGFCLGYDKVRSKQQCVAARPNPGTMYGLSQT